MVASQVQAKVVEIVNKARAKAQTHLAEAQQQAQVQQIEADSKLQATKAKYGALAEEAKSEAQNLDAFDAQRRHQFEMKKATVFTSVASKQKNMVVSGKAGESFLNSVININDLNPPPRK